MTREQLQLLKPLSAQAAYVKTHGMRFIKVALSAVCSHRVAQHSQWSVSDVRSSLRAPEMAGPFRSADRIRRFLAASRIREEA